MKRTVLGVLCVLLIGFQAQRTDSVKGPAHADSSVKGAERPVRRNGGASAKGAAQVDSSAKDAERPVRRSAAERRNEGSRADFSGHWKLDIRKSKNLKPEMTQLDSYLLEVEQSADSMVVRPAMQGAGQRVTLPPTIYRFDSSEVFRSDTLRGSKRWIRSAWYSTGAKFIATTRVELTRGKSKESYIERDVWQFARRGTLRIFRTQTYTDSDSVHTEERVFHRAKQ